MNVDWAIDIVSEKIEKYFIKQIVSKIKQKLMVYCVKIHVNVDFLPAKMNKHKYDIEISYFSPKYIACIFTLRLFLLHFDHFFLLRLSVNFSLMVFEMFWMVLRDSLRISLVSRVLVWIRRFILASEGCGILYPANSTSALPFNTTLNKLPNV